MTVFGVVFVRALGRGGVEAEAWIIESFETNARRVVAHDRVTTEEFEEGVTFEFGRVGSCDLVEGGFEALGRRSERVDERKPAAESELDLGIVSDHMIDKFGDTGVVSTGCFIARDD